RNVAINVVLMTFVSMMPGVSWTGHLGGAALGAVAGGLLSINRFGTRPQRWLAAGGVVLATALCIASLLWAAAHDKKWQQTRGNASAKTDADDLYGYYLPRAEHVQEEADSFYQKQVHPLVVLPPAERDAKAVQEAITGLEQ